MSDQNRFKLSTAVVFYPLLFVFAIWVVFWVETRFGVRFVTWGIMPREIYGLRGVFFSPFIHGSLSHLYNNSLPLLVLSAALFYFYPKQSWKVLGFSLLGSGLFTWLIGVTSYHIGASGVIYALVSFIFFGGIRSQNYRLAALSMLMVFLYGSMLWYLFPVKEGISWEGHLSGFLTGAALAMILTKNFRSSAVYEWEKEDFDESEDAFMQHFDENGDFVPHKQQPKDESAND